ncbi:hypothetical protein TrVE_jg2285 [Triparma verrucosa]|uniref:Uncharacterized protein n=1 Tax=Triparma verrucosa TaxID=1606542 RepID=A0A9W7FEC5_9STRA|nr:hypothetical protein TrVE_jg2285 [Triparma verrucosa]
MQRKSSPPPVKPKQAGKFRPKRKKKSDSPSPNPSPTPETGNAASPMEEESTSPARSSPAPMSSSLLPPPPGTKQPQARRAKGGKGQSKGMPRGKVVMGAMTAQEVKESEKKMGLSPVKASSKKPAAAAADSDEEIIASIEDKNAAAKKKPIAMLESSSDSDSSSFEESMTPTTKKIATKKVAKKKEPAVYEFVPSDEDSDSEEATGKELAVEPRQLPLSGKALDFDTKLDLDAEASVFQPLTATKAKLKEENDGVFLFKLPTRLPALKKVETVVIGEAASDIALLSSGAAALPDASESEAQATKKDDDSNPYNELSKMSGKIGRIDVYDDGSAELILTGPDGNEIRMDVDDGIKCGFKQTAVWMDTENATYEEVGDVFKSIVVTPQL